MDFQGKYSESAVNAGTELGRNRALVLLSTAELFNRVWYLSELVNTLRHNERGKKVSSFLMRWEDVLMAVG